jgi:hypothetical protein
MGTRRSIGLLFIAAIACIGCCAIPISGIIAGVTSLGFVETLMNQNGLDIVLCTVPLILLIAFTLYRHQRKNRCCSLPNIECSSTQCSTRNKTPENRK